MSEISTPLLAGTTAGASTTGHRRGRIRVIATIAVTTLVVGGVIGVGATFASAKIDRLEQQRTELRRDNTQLLSTKAHDEAALKATRSTLAETSAQVATMKAKVAQAQAAVKDAQAAVTQAQTDASGQYTQGYSAGSNDSYNSGYNSGYDSGYNAGYDQGYNDGYGS
jgi:hypothetical protein